MPGEGKIWTMWNRGKRYLKTWKEPPKQCMQTKLTKNGYIHNNQKMTHPVFLHHALQKKQEKSFYFSPWLLENGPVFFKGVCRQKTTSKIGRKHQKKNIPNLVVKARIKLCWYQFILQTLYLQWLPIGRELELNGKIHNWLATAVTNLNRVHYPFLRTHNFRQLISGVEQT